MYCSLGVSVKSVFVATQLDMQVSVLSFNCASVRHLFPVYKRPSSLSCVQVSVFSFLCTHVRLLFPMYKCLSSLLRVSVFSFLCARVCLLFYAYTCLSSLTCIQFPISFLCTNVLSFAPIQPAALTGRLITYTSVFMNSCVYRKSVRNHV